MVVGATVVVVGAHVVVVGAALAAFAAVSMSSPDGSPPHASIVAASTTASDARLAVVLHEQDDRAIFTMASNPPASAERRR